jgi:DNA-binding Lrp family transcriptional regulator
MKQLGILMQQTRSAGSKMDNKDRQIIGLISAHFPLDIKPFLTIARELDVNENDLIERVKSLKNNGLIRRIGATIDPRKIGWFSTLCVADVPKDRLEVFSKIVNNYREITHNYERTGTPNCWFTIIVPDKIKALRIISEIENACGISILELPARRIFKIGVKFSL